MDVRGRLWVHSLQYKGRFKISLRPWKIAPLRKAAIPPGQYSILIVLGNLLPLGPGLLRVNCHSFRFSCRLTRTSNAVSRPDVEVKGPNTESGTTSSLRSLPQQLQHEGRHSGDTGLDGGLGHRRPERRMKRRQGLAGALAFLEGLRADAADVHHADGDFRLRTAKLREVFSAHRGRLLDEVILTEPGLERGHEPFGQLRIVVKGGGDFVSHLDLGQAVLGHSGGKGLSARNAFDRLQGLLPHLFLIRTHRQLETHLVGNDVAPGATVNGANRDHRRLAGLDLAADDGLKAEED